MPTCYRHPGRESYIRCQRCDRTICPDCMRDASVGFQCPTCVAEGAKSTRSGRTAYGGARSGNPALTSMVLIALNAAVWLAIAITGGASSRLVDLLALRPSGLCLANGQAFDISQQYCEVSQGLWLPAFTDGAWWQLLSSGFAHVSIMHIGFNMLALWIIGPQLELVLGRARFLLLYVLSLFAASAVVLWAGSEFQSTLGASGAIYGLFAALIVVVRKVGGDLRSLLVLMGVNAFLTFAVPNISWQGHLGGFVGGLAVTAVLVYAPRQNRAAWQYAGLTVIGVLVAVAIIARTLVLA